MKPDHNCRRREVGCQGDPAEMRDASIQVDLLTQQFSGRCSGGCGAQWQCVSIREDAGGGLLQHINLLLPQTAGSPALYLLYPTRLPTKAPFSQSESEEPVHRCSLPSMLHCNGSFTEGGMCEVPSSVDIPAVPPGLIAPLSPCLAEEEEEDEMEEHLLEQEKDKSLSPDQLTLKAAKRKKMSHVSNTKSWPTDSLTNHTAGKPPPSKNSLCRPAKNTKPMEDDKDKELQTEQQEEKHQETSGKPSAGIHHSPAAGGVIEPKTDETKQSGRPRRTMVHPPIRFLLEYEEQSHVFSFASQSRETKTNVKKKAVRIQQREKKDKKMDQVSTEGHGDSSRMESDDGGVQRWRQRCQVCGLSFTSWSSLQLHLSVHRAGRTLSCQLCNRRFTCSSSLHLHCHKHHSSYKAGCHGSRIRAKLREAESGGSKKEEVEQLENWPRFPELTVGPDWSSHKHTSKSSSWWVDYKALKKKSSERRMRGQQDEGLMERKRKRCRTDQEMGVKKVCMEKIAQGQKAELPQRPRRKMVGPPVRYLLESEELSHGPIKANKTCQYGDKIKHGVGAQEEVIGSGASQAIDKLDDMKGQSDPITSERQTSHMVAEGEDEEKRRNNEKEINEEAPQRLRRKLVSPPIRYLLQSEELSHRPVTTSHNQQDQSKRLKPTKVNSEAEGVALIMIDSSEASEKQQGHMTSEGETGHLVFKADMKIETQRRNMVSPPIRYIVEFEELSHGIVTPSYSTENNIRQSLERPKKVVYNRDAEGSALKMTDSPKDVAAPTSHIVLNEKREAEDGRIHGEGNEQVEGQPWRPRRKTVGPPIRYLLESEELSNSFIITNQITENKPKQSIEKTKEVEGGSDVQDVALPMVGRSDLVKNQACYETSDRPTVHMGSKVKRDEDSRRPRRRMVGPPIRYLLESEELSHVAVATNHSTQNKPKLISGKPSQADCKSISKGVASEVIDRSEVVAREMGHMVSKEKRENPQKPRRNMVEPLIGYLLQSEERPHGIVSASRCEEYKISSVRPKKDVTDAGGGASEVIDRSKDVVKQSTHIVLKEKEKEDRRIHEGKEKVEEQLKRPIRITMDPPVRSLSESEDLCHGSVLANHSTEKDTKQSLGGLKRVVCDSDAMGGALDVIDCPKEVVRQTGHKLLMEGRDEQGRKEIDKANEKVEEKPVRPRRRMVGPPIRYLLESEELSHVAVATIHSAQNKPKLNSGKPSQADCKSISKGMTSEVIDRSEVVAREMCHMVSKEEREDLPKTRRNMVEPLIGYLLQSEERPHGIVSASRCEENKISSVRPKKDVTEAEGRASEVIDRSKDVAIQSTHIVLKEKRDNEDRRTLERNEKVEKQLKKPIRITMDPPVKYLLESEDLCHGSVTANHSTEKDAKQPSLVVSDSDALGGASKVMGRSEIINRQMGHMTSHRETCHVVSKEEGEKAPQRPRRKMVGPPIRYLLESETLSHSGVATNHKTGVKTGQSSGISKQVVGESGAEGYTSQMIDSPEDVARRTNHTVSKEETNEEERRVDGEAHEGVYKQPRRLRRVTVDPPTRYLLESEEPHGIVTTNPTTVNKSIQNGKPKQVEKNNVEDGVSNIIDWSEAIDGQGGHMTIDGVKDHMVLREDGDKEPQKLRRMAGPPVKYLQQSEELSHGAVTTNHNVDGNIVQGLERSKKVVSDGDYVCEALKMIDNYEKTGQMDYDTEKWTYLVYRDLQSGQVTIILPCFVRLHRIL